MRCPDCSKFVSLDTRDPEIGNVDCQYSGTTVAVTADGRTCRNCANCGTELKALDWSSETAVELDEFDNYDKLSEGNKKQLEVFLDAGSAVIECEENGCQVDETGGGRYQKNYIVSAVNFKLKVCWTEEAPAGWPEDPQGNPLELTFDGEVESRNAASEFEEQV